MTSELTITVNYEKPKNGAAHVLAKYGRSSGASVWERSFVRDNWSNFEWWSEIPAPVKPRRFVGEPDERNVGHYWVRFISRKKIVADSIPNEQAAQAIADIYEANQ